MKKFARNSLVSGDAHESSRRNAGTSVTNEAMALLGLSDEDLDPLSIGHFLKQVKTVEEATLLYHNHTEKRIRHLQDLEAKRKELAARGPPKVTRPSGEVLHEQHMINLNNEQTARMEQQNDATLRRLAIQQVRTVFHLQKEEALMERIDRQSIAQREKAQSARQAGRRIAETREFASRALELEPRPMKDIEAHIQRAESVRMARQNERKQNAEELRQMVVKVHQNSASILDETVEKARQKVVNTERRVLGMPAKYQERDKGLQARAEARDEVAHAKIQKVKETEIERVEQRNRERADREVRSKALIQKNLQELQARLAKEKEDLQRRNKAAEQIWASIEQQKVESARQVREQHAEAHRRMAEQEKEKRAKVFEKAATDAQRGEDRRRAARQRMFEAQVELREKVEMANGFVANLEPERNKALAAKDRVRGSFTERRSALLAAAPGMRGMTSQELVAHLRELLKITQQEAESIIEAARQPRSFHDIS
jgi:hypothetical protein